MPKSVFDLAAADRGTHEIMLSLYNYRYRYRYSDNFDAQVVFIGTYQATVPRFTNGQVYAEVRARVDRDLRTTEAGAES